MILKKNQPYRSGGWINITALLLYLLFCAIPLFAQVPESFLEAMEIYNLGHLAFAELRHQDALGHFSLVEEYIEIHPDQRLIFDHHYRDFSMIEIVRRHWDLGRFSPATRHKILVMYISRTDASYEGNPIRETLTTEMKKQAELAQEVCKRYVEAMSGGELTLSFARMDCVSTVTGLKSFQSMDHGIDPIVTFHADLESLKPYPGDNLLEN